MAGDALDLRGEALHTRRVAWLKKHDKQTGGILGLLPLVRGMPIRFTNTVDRERQASKHARGTLIAWQLADHDKDKLQNNKQAEYVLDFMPKLLFIQMPKVFGEEDDDRTKEDNVLALKPGIKTWALDREGNAKIQRRGFEIMPDFGGTAHGYCGSTLQAAIVDLLQADRTPTRDDMLKAYIAVSRVRTADALLIVQPYHPMLFRQGMLPGPHLLMQFWRGNLDVHQVQREWEHESSSKKEKITKKVRHLK